MKKILFMAVIAMTIFASCQKDEKDPTTNVVSPELEGVTPKSVEVALNKDENDEPVLSFKTEADMNDQIQNLHIMSETELEQWYSGFDGFVSQDQFMWSVVEELDMAQSLEEVKAIHNKYAGLLIFNDNEADMDISPYIPSTHFTKGIACNKSGNVMINGKIHNFNNITSHSEFESPLTKFLVHDEYKQTGTIISVKYGYSRLFVRAYYYFGDTIYLWLESQRKTWLGFNKYKTHYNLRFEKCEGWNIDFSSNLGVSTFNVKPNWYTTPELKSSNYHSFMTSKLVDYELQDATFTLWVTNDRITTPHSLTVNWPL